MPKSRKVYKRRRTFKRKGKARAKVAPIAGEPSVRATYKSIPYNPRVVRWGTASGEVPQRMTIKMSYDDLNIAVAPGAISHVHNMNLNSIHQPNITGGATFQPNFHDAMATLYTRYKVHAVKYRINFHSTNTTTRTLFGVLGTNTLPTAVALDVARARCKQSCLISVAGDSGDSATLSGYLKLRTLAGPFFNDINFSSAYGATPTDPLYLGIFFNTEDATTNIGGRMSIHMTFYVENSEPQVLRALD